MLKYGFLVVYFLVGVGALAVSSLVSMSGAALRPMDADKSVHDAPSKQGYWYVYDKPKPAPSSGRGPGSGGGGGSSGGGGWSGGK